MADQVNITITDLIPPSNIATVDKNDMFGNTYDKRQTDAKIGTLTTDFNAKIAEVREQVNSDFKGTLKPSMAAPTEDGSYRPEISSDLDRPTDPESIVDWGEKYPNAGNLRAKSGYDTTFYKKGTVWSKVENELPKEDAIEIIKKVTTPFSSKGVLFDKLANSNYLQEFDYNEINDLESKVILSIKNLKISGYNGELKMTLIKSGNTITEFKLDNGNDLFITLTNSLHSVDNNVFKYKHSQNYQNKIICIDALIDASGGDFVYSFDNIHNPNLKIVETGDILIVPEKSIVNSIFELKGEKNELGPIFNTMYLKFQISEPIILGSISVNVNRIPLENPAWIECGIFPPDNGFGTAKRIASSDQIQVSNIGILRLPLEHKVLEAGEYAIAFKTNTNCFDMALNINSFRGYDSMGPMPNIALNLSYPSSDKYGKFIAFSLHEYKKTKNIYYPVNWHLNYEPENIFLGTEDENPDLLFYYHYEGMAGQRTIRLSQSNDGGITKVFLHTNNIPEDFETIYGMAKNAVSIFKNNKRIVFVNFHLGKIVKFEISNNIATWTEITPTNKSISTTSHPVTSYAPLVIFKNFLYWGEYQDPATPRIHKMNLDTGVWSISIEKPTSGPNGARHVHFLYKSPINPNVLWAVWGDASNGGGQGLNRLEMAGSNSSSSDSWTQWTTGVHDSNKTTLPYPTGIIEVFGIGIIGAGDQPPAHLIKCNNIGNAGSNMFYPINFKDESAPITETVHWLTIDDDKTIYYMTVESSPYMSVYACPYPYNEKYRISKYWQQALAGVANYSKGIITMGQHSFPKVKFRNISENNSISKVPYVENATSENAVTVLNKLLENLQKSNLMQSGHEQGADKNQSNWVGGNQFENFN